jgi:hypothetical protein
MANPTDPTFLTGFDADAFRSAITSTMELAMPVNEDERVTFRFKIQRTYEKADPSGNPYDFTAVPTEVEERDDVQIPCAVEFVGRRSDGSPIGQFENPTVVITVLDVHYPQVQGSNQALLGGNTYNIDFVEPPVSLGPVTVYRIWLTAVDES